MTFCLAFGTATKNNDQKIIEAWFPQPVLNPSAELVSALSAVSGYENGQQSIEISAAQSAELATAFSQAGDSVNAAFAEKAAKSNQTLVLVILEKDDAPSSIAEAFLKLQLISNRLVKPHGVNLNGMFGLLHNIAWTSEGAIDLPELAERQLQARLEGRVISVDSVDKFPKMTDYVVPTGVRIADASRVRLGAHIGEGTTIMHEGFVNFNAGTEGVSMVEGRISAGVMVGNGSDLGGGCSTMGTLSGGGNIVIAVGENSLIGANAGIGFPLGDRCTVESGLYITAGTKIQMIDNDGKEAGVVKARDLTNKTDLLFRRNSLTGQTQCLTNKSAIELNAELHANN
jgi:2,3,4,5-tetrahydropyridine-2,6-dicarboxylate N-succinyltransferase